MPVLRHAVKAAATTFDRLHPPRPGIVILIYHRIGGGTSSQIDLPTGVFEAQLDELAERETVISLDEATRRLETADNRPGTVITFDDGTRDFHDVAAPLLVERWLPSTLYLATHFVESGDPFPGGPKPATWTGLREATSTGLVTIASHTHRHLLLDRAPADEAIADIDRSTALIESRLGVRAEHFAYPRALPPTHPVDEAVRVRFRTAAVAGTRPNAVGADLHRLSRSPIQRSDEMDYFRAKVAGGMALEDGLRRSARRITRRVSSP